MNFFYNFLLIITNKGLYFASLLSSKLKLFVSGRKKVWAILDAHIKENDKIFWVHCASLGEYEQGVPVMQELKKNYPKYKLLVTFFSPSGYEAKKNSKLADVIVYLPMDTRANASRFINKVQPVLAIFVKYEFWPNYLQVLKSQNIPIIFISSVFRKEQVFFKWYGGFMRKSLQTIDYFFVQDQASHVLVDGLGFKNVSISGDTRFDRVAKQLEMDNKLDFIQTFVNNRICIVIGSSWPADEEVFIDFINSCPEEEVCFIIAPHEIKNQQVQNLQSKIKVPSVRYTEKSEKPLEQSSVFVLDTIGYLSRVYSYADIAYVGGGMGTSGLHNILEPATFGIPIIIGKNFENFREAKQLQKLAGLFSVSSSEEFNGILQKLIKNPSFREKTGMIAGHFINSNTGATRKIMAFLEEKLNGIHIN